MEPLPRGLGLDSQRWASQRLLLSPKVFCGYFYTLALGLIPKVPPVKAQRGAGASLLQHWMWRKCPEQGRGRKRCGCAALCTAAAERPTVDGRGVGFSSISWNAVSLSALRLSLGLSWEQRCPDAVCVLLLHVAGLTP